MKKTILTTFICSVIVVGVALAGFVVYDNFLSDDNEQNNQAVEWVNYLTNQNLILTKSVWDNVKDECVYEKVNIASNDMKKLLNELSTKNITKDYYGTIPPTGTLCSNRYKLEYSDYNISLESDGVMWVNDKSLSNKIDLEIDNTVGTASSEYVYRFDVDFASIINNYVTTKNNNKYFNSNTLSETSYTSKYYQKTATAYGDVSKYSNIFEYFQDLESVSIKLDYATNEIKEENNYETVYHRDEYNLTSSEINDFFNDMKSTKQKLVGGFGGSSNVDYLYISYKINNKVHTTKIMIGMWLLEETTDGNIYKIIDNNMPKSEWDVLLIADAGSNSLTNLIDRLNNK